MPDLHNIQNIFDTSGSRISSVAPSQGWVDIDVQEASASATIEFTGFSPALYDEFEVRIFNVAPATDGVALYMRFSDDGGVSFEATNYEWGYNITTPAATNVAAGSDATGSTAFHLKGGLGNTTNEDSEFTVRIGDLANGQHKRITWNAAVTDLTPDIGSITGAGRFTLNTSNVDGIQFLMSSGNIASGKFILRGRKKITAVPDLNLLTQSPDWEIIDVQEASASAQIDMLFDPNLYDEIEMSVLEFNVATDGDNTQLLVSEDGGSTFKTGASDYAYYTSSYNMTTTPVENLAGDDLNSFIRINDSNGTATEESTSFKISLFSPSQSSAKKFLYSGVGRLSDATEYYIDGGGVYIGTTNPINALRIKASTGNITSGKFILRGRRKISAAPITGGESVTLQIEKPSTAVANLDLAFDGNLYEKIIVEIYDIQPVTDAQELWLRITDDNFATVEAGASDYSWENNLIDQTATPNDAQGGDNADSEINLVGSLGNVAGEVFSMTVTLFAPGSSNRKHISWMGSGLRSGGVDSDGIVGSASFYGNTNVVNGIRLLFATGNIAAGCRVILRGIKKVV